MFKIVVFVVAIATGKPVGVGISNDTYKSEAECRAHVEEVMKGSAAHVAGRADLKLVGGCATKEAVDALEKSLDDDAQKKARENSI